MGMDTVMATGIDITVVTAIVTAVTTVRTRSTTGTGKRR